jgi:hypothetical protein
MEFPRYVRKKKSRGDFELLFSTSGLPWILPISFAGCLRSLRHSSA